MRRKSYIAIIVGLAAALVALTAVAGCGEETKTTARSAIQCDTAAPSIIPAPSGRPQLVEFFRDT